MSLTEKERRQKLRNQAFEAMTERAKSSTFEKHQYVYRPKDA